VGRSLYPDFPAPTQPNAGGAFELGQRFKDSAGGFVTKLRYVRASAEPAVDHTLRLWSAAGVELASAVAPAGASGTWHEAILATPYELTPDTEYVVSVSVTDSRAENVSGNWPPPSPGTGTLVSVGGVSQGVFHDPPLGTFPTSSVQSLYWVDVVVEDALAEVRETVVTYMDGATLVGRLTIDGFETLTDWPGLANAWWADGLANAAQWAYLQALVGDTTIDTFTDPDDVDMTGAPPEVDLPDEAWISREQIFTSATIADLSTAQAELDALADDDVPPTAPASLDATAISSTAVLVAWPAATDNVGVVAYLVERCEGEACTGFVQIVSRTTTSYIDTGRTPETVYRYRVRAVDDAGNFGPYSPIAEATTPELGTETGLAAIVSAMAAALEPLKATIPDLQVYPFLNPNPTPPSIDIYPADPFQSSSGFGQDMDTFWVVRARTTTADHEAGQRALLRMLDRGAPESVEEALTADQTLGGLVQSLGIPDEGVSGYRVYLEDPQGNGSLIGVEWRLEVITK